MNTYYFFTFPGHPRPHIDLAFICEDTSGEDPVGVVQYQARRSELPVDLIKVTAENRSDAVRMFNEGKGVVVCRVTAETTYKITEDVQ